MSAGITVLSIIIIVAVAIALLFYFVSKVFGGLQGNDDKEFRKKAMEAYAEEMRRKEAVAVAEEKRTGKKRPHHPGGIAGYGTVEGWMYSWTDDDDPSTLTEKYQPFHDCRRTDLKYAQLIPPHSYCSYCNGLCVYPQTHCSSCGAPAKYDFEIRQKPPSERQCKFCEEKEKGKCPKKSFDDRTTSGICEKIKRY